MRLRTFTICIVCFSLIGCNRSDGDRLVRIGWRVTQKVQALTPEQIPLPGVVTLTPVISNEQRVRDRINSDRYLAPVDIAITVVDSTVRLQGIVSDSAPEVAVLSRSPNRRSASTR